MMFSKLSAVVLTAFAFTTNAAVLNMYSDENCENWVGSRNVWDNTCAEGVPGFQSFVITSGGGGGQLVTTWSPDACAGAYTNCVSAGSVGQCFLATDYAGGSNAISSSYACGSV